MREYIYYKPFPYQLDAAEILKEIGETPHMVLRIHIRGEYFPHRNAAPFARIRIQDRRDLLRALYCEIDDDQAGFRAYFPTDISLRGTLAVGYGDEIVAEFDLERVKLEVARLDEGRIETAFRRVTQRDLGVFKLQR